MRTEELYYNLNGYSSQSYQICCIDFSQNILPLKSIFLKFSNFQFIFFILENGYPPQPFFGFALSAAAVAFAADADAAL